MARRINVDGIRIEGEEAERIIAEAMANQRDLASAEDGKVIHSLGMPPGLLVTLIIFPALTVPVVFLALRAFQPQLPWLSNGWRTFICIFVCLLATTVISRMFWRFRKRQLRAAMKRRGFDLCEDCGYWLKGLSPGQEHCPECGATRA